MSINKELNIADMRKMLYQLYRERDNVYFGITVTNENKDALSNSWSEKNNLFLEYFTQVSQFVDAETSKNPFAGFPLVGERIIRVGMTFSFEWNYKLIPDVDVFFIKGGTKMPVTLIEQDTPGVKKFVITIAHFSDEYVPCKVILQSKKIDTIFDESLTFKVLKGNN